MPDSLIGKNLNQYRIIRLLNEDAIGSAYQAQDENLQREVILKAIGPSVASRPKFEDSFVQAARIGARLDHPGVIRVLDFGKAQSSYYLVMEYVGGKNLKQLMEDLKTRGRWIPLIEAVQIVRHLALAAEYLRNQDNVQPRIKPEIVSIKPGGANGLPYRPVLTDPGLVGFLGGRLFPEGDAPEDNLAYLAPEQTVRQGSDARSDVYSLGILLFELATGQLPFPIQTRDEAVRYHIRQPAPSPRSIRPDLPEFLERIILTTLEKNPAQRFPDPATLAGELEQVLPAVSQVNTPPPAFEGVSSLMIPYLESLNEPGRTAVFEDPGATKAIPEAARSEGKGIQIVIENTQLSVEPGSSIMTRAYIINQGLPAGYFRISIEGLPAGWFSMTPTVIQLGPGEQKEVRFTIEPPRVPQSRAGRYPFTVQVSGEPAPGKIAEIPGTLTLAAFSRFSSLARPPVISVGEVGQVSVENLGNTPETFTINFSDLEDYLAFTPPQANLRLVEGQSGTVEFKAALRQPRWIGGERQYPLITQVSAASGETQTHSLDFVSRPILPVWILGVLLFTCLCSAGLLAFYFSRAGLEETRGTATVLAALTGTAESIESTSEALTATALFLGNANQATIQAVTATAAWLEQDSDGDGLSNRRELELGTDPQDSDTDGDGIPDGQDATPIHTSTPTLNLGATAQAATQTAAAQQQSANQTGTAQAILTGTAQAATETAQSGAQATAAAATAAAAAAQTAAAQTAVAQTAIAETAIALTSTAEAPTDTPPTPQPGRIAFIHAINTGTANNFRSLLQDNGFTVDLILQEAIPTIDFGPYQAILLGPDTGSEGAWGDPEGNLANQINQTGLPVLGIEEGGASYFGLLNLPIGWENSITGEETRVFVVDPANPAWTTPNQIPIPGDQNLQLYSTNSDFVAVNGEPPPAEVQLIARHPSDPTHFIVSSYQDRFWFWGFEDAPDAMNDAGRQLFVNLVDNLLP